MVALNRIYTRVGDDGSTALADGQRRPKHDLRVEAYGTVDETNACVGLARIHTEGEVDAMLSRIQHDLFDLGADLATPESDKSRPGAVPAPPEGKKGRRREPLRVLDGQVERLEREIDTLNADLSPLRSFVL